MPVFEQTFPLRKECVFEIRTAVGDFASRCGFSPDIVTDIKIAVGEACSNILEHSGSSTVRVSCECNDVIVVTLEDYGHGFRKPKKDGRGLGIPIMRALMDQVNFQHKFGNGTTIRLVKNKKTRRDPRAAGLPLLLRLGFQKAPRRAPGRRF